MIQAYDHRAASVKIEEANWMRQGQTDATTLVEHQNPEFVAQPRWWVEDSEVNEGLKDADLSWLIGFKDITSPKISEGDRSRIGQITWFQRA
jgi:hypothetical protein